MLSMSASVSFMLQWTSNIYMILLSLIGLDIEILNIEIVWDGVFDER